MPIDGIIDGVEEEEEDGVHEAMALVRRARSAITDHRTRP